MNGSSDAKGRRDAAIAWLCLAGFILSFPAAFGVGEGLSSLFGYDVGTSVMPPLWVILASTVPALVVFALPGIAAWIFGRRARREGQRRGMVPAWIGVTIAGLFTLTNVAAAFVPGM
ncbi:MAG TPA: hypothetical protein VFK68_08045 [Propionibacteriaceae bacterium]|nr:hypothetical protein [Propionibacteriaceae bacterium]